MEYLVVVVAATVSATAAATVASFYRWRYQQQFYC